MNVKNKMHDKSRQAKSVENKKMPRKTTVADLENIHPDEWYEEEINPPRLDW